MKSDSQRKLAYEARMLSTLLDPTLAAVNAKAVTNYNSYVDEYYPLQVQLRGILAKLAIPVHWYIGFEAFNGEAYHLSKVCPDTVGLTFNMAKLVAKWAGVAKLSAGNLPTLKEIALQLYSVTIP
jgi:hypothetical protein